jgi:hypothetical protein
MNHRNRRARRVTQRIHEILNVIIIHIIPFHVVYF